MSRRDLKLIVEGQELELPKIEVNATYVLEDVVSVNIKSNPFTKEIIVPGTKKNNLILQNAFKIDAIGVESARKLLKAHFDVNGFVMVDGVFRILSTPNRKDKNFYRSQVVGGGGWAEDLREKELSDISVPNFIYTKANVIASFSNNGDTGDLSWGFFSYALLTFSGQITEGHLVNDVGGQLVVEMSQLRPCLFVKPLIIKIFDNIGWEVEFKGAVVNSQQFRDLILPFSRGDYNTNSAEAKADGTQLIDTQTGSANCSTDFYNKWSESILFPTEVSDPNNLIVSPGKFEANSNSDYEIEANIDVDYGCETQSITHKIVKTFVVGENQFYYVKLHTKDPGCTYTPFTTIGGANPDKIEILDDDLNVLLTVNDPTEPDWDDPLVIDTIFSVSNQGNGLIQVLFEVKPAWGSFFDTLATNCPASIVKNDSFKFTWKATFPKVLDTTQINVFDRVIDITKNMPDISQIGLLKSVALMFKLWFITDTKNKVVTIINRDDFYDENRFVDWTDKLDVSKQIEIVELVSTQKRVLSFKYNNHTDDEALIDFQRRFRKELGSGEYQFSSDLNVDEEDVTSEMVFSATRMATENSFHLPGSFVGDIGEEIGQRILIYGGYVPAPSSYKLQAFNDFSILTSYPYMYFYKQSVGPSDIHLSFGNFKDVPAFFTNDTGLIDRYWKKQLDLINTGKLVKMSLKLELSDVVENNLDFSPVYKIDNNYYLLNRINDYDLTSPDICTAEFILKTE